jgi:hypothetical protein
VQDGGAVRQALAPELLDHPARPLGVVLDGDVPGAAVGPALPQQPGEQDGAGAAADLHDAAAR